MTQMSLMNKESKREHRKFGLKLLDPSTQIQTRIHRMYLIQRQNYWKNATIHCAVLNVEVLNQQEKKHNKFYEYVESNKIKTLHWSVSINTMGQIYSAFWIQLKINNNIIEFLNFYCWWLLFIKWIYILGRSCCYYSCAVVVGFFRNSSYTYM